MFENHDCRLCNLCNVANSVCLQGVGNRDTAKLAIFTDYPLYMDDIRGRPYVSDSGQLLIAMLNRMSLNVERDVRLDFIVKCSPGKFMPTKKRDRLAVIEACSGYRFATLQSMPNLTSLVAMGRLSLEAFNGSSEIGRFEGECWTPHEPLIKARLHHFWVTYSPAYLIEKPAETPNIYRTIWTAAEEAGLNPKEDATRFKFQWPD